MPNPILTPPPTPTKTKKKKKKTKKKNKTKKKKKQQQKTPINFIQRKFYPTRSIKALIKQKLYVLQCLSNLKVPHHLINVNKLSLKITS